MKKFILLLVASFIFLNITAQISTAWTYTGSLNDVPSGVTIPDVDRPSGSKKFDFDVLIDRSSVDNANQVTGFAALGAAVKTEIDSNWVVDSFGLNPSLDITARINITEIDPDLMEFDIKDRSQLMKVGTAAYRCRGRFEFLKE